MDDKRLARTHSTRGWTQPDEYVAALARKRTARKSRRPDPKNQHEASRFPIHMLPFVALMLMFAILVIATVLIAFPGNPPTPKPRQLAGHEKGYAPKGWLEEAERQFH